MIGRLHFRMECFSIFTAVNVRRLSKKSNTFWIKYFFRYTSTNDFPTFLSLSKIRLSQQNSPLFQRGPLHFMRISSRQPFFHVWEEKKTQEANSGE